jgi:undecaprenyl-diphosphatase
MNSFDITVYHFINHFAATPNLLNPIMVFFASYSPEVYAALFVVAWFALPKENSEQRHALVVSVFSAILALLINVVIAHFWFRPRPFAVLPKGSFTQLTPHPADASFPSDHVSGGFGFAAAAWGKTAKWVSYSFTTLAVIVMIARVYVGVHWPTDVLAGMVVGIVASRVMWRLNPVLRPITDLGLRIFRYGRFARS